MSLLRPDLAIIADHVAPSTRVLDIGCGDGTLMAELRQRSDVDARGLELDADNVAAGVAKGLSVIQGDADTDLSYYPDGAFDYAILSQTLQTTRHPHKVLDALVRIGRHGFVSFPNFAYWRVRWALMWNGRMPMTAALPVSWYETENIHQLTVADFRALVAELGITVEDCWFLSQGQRISASGANWRAEHAVFLLRR